MARASFHPLAERELIDAAQFYDLKSPGLGARFLDAAERCERAIIEYPQSGTPILGDIRRRMFQTFPYAFLRILAVMNLKRRPMYWVERE